MTRPQDQYLFKFTVTISTSADGTLTTESHDEVCCIIETKTGALILHDRYANVIAMYAAGNWYKITTSDVQPVPPRTTAAPMFDDPTAIVPSRIGTQG